VAGFSERWAQDTLTSVLPGTQAKPKAASGKSAPAAKDPPPRKETGHF
jgi:hypothetical protein